MPDFTSKGIALDQQFMMRRKREVAMRLLEQAAAQGWDEIKVMQEAAKRGIADDPNVVQYMSMTAKETARKRAEQERTAVSEEAARAAGILAPGEMGPLQVPGTEEEYQQQFARGLAARGQQLGIELPAAAVKESATAQAAAAGYPTRRELLSEERLQLQYKQLARNKEKDVIARWNARIREEQVRGADYRWRQKASSETNEDIGKTMTLIRENERMIKRYKDVDPKQLPVFDFLLTDQPWSDELADQALEFLETRKRDLDDRVLRLEEDRKRYRKPARTVVKEEEARGGMGAVPSTPEERAWNKVSQLHPEWSEEEIRREVSRLMSIYSGR